MSEKTKIPDWPTGMPFGGNCDEVAAQIVRDTIAHRQKFIATVNNTIMAADPGIFTLKGGSATLKGESAMVANAAVLKPDGMATGSPVLGQPDLVVHCGDDTQAPNPPAIADFLLALFARSKRDVAAVGDINELFDRECAKYGRARANRWYWAKSLGFLLPLLARAISRATKLAILIGVLRRYFFD